jgi:hypothetical protein
MIKTAAQILAELPPERDHPYPANRRSRSWPLERCRNWYRGCPGNTKEKQCGHGWCRRCYNRWKLHGDSWHHSPRPQYCTQRDCFMKGTPGHP